MADTFASQLCQSRLFKFKAREERLRCPSIAYEIMTKPPLVKAARAEKRKGVFSNTENLDVPIAG